MAQDVAPQRESVQIPGVAHQGGRARGFLPFGTRIGDYLFSGGCMGQDPATGRVVDGGAGPQAEFAFRNVQTLLDTAGFAADDVVRVWMWIKDESVREALAGPWQAMFPQPASRPAASVVVSDLPNEMVVQLEIVAVRGGQPRRSIFLPGQEGAVYPAGSVKGDLLCTGNLAGHDLSTGKLPEDSAGQVEAAFEKLQAVLEGAGCSPESVGHMLCWYRDHQTREVINQPFMRLFPTQGNRPARHSVVRSLPGNELVQIEAMATIGARRQNYEVPGIWHTGIQGIPNSLPFGTRTGKLLYSAATYGKNLHTGSSGASAEEQAEWAFVHTRTLLEQAGMSLGDVAHMFVWFKDHAYREAVNEPWMKYFPNPADRPARHAIKTDLPRDFLIQIEVIAVASS